MSARTTAQDPPAPMQEEMPAGRAAFRMRLVGQGSARLGTFQVIVGLAAIWTVFALANDRFLSPANLTNLTLQVASVGVMSIGIVLVLLTAQIDLSVGSVSGAATAMMVVLNVSYGLPATLTLVLAVAGGAVIGLIHGLVTTLFGVPSFVVTLGGLLTWQGLQLFLLGDTGAVNITDPVILGLTRTFFVPGLGWGVAAVILGLLVLDLLHRRRARRRAGLALPGIVGEGMRLGFLALAMAAALAVFTADRGVPLSVVILVALVVLMDWVCRRTAFGRRVFAVGGNAVAAERVGIKVRTTQTLVLVLSGTFAAIGGILGASRLMAVNQSFGSGEILLYAIAGAVIGGTSLFGGRGSVWSALLGALVIGSISNGMDLLAFESSVKLMITGTVLVIAVVLDSLTRRRRD